MAHAESDSQKALDHELSAAETARLAASLEKHPDARQEFERLKSVDTALRGLEAFDPPAGLRQEVMRQVRLREALKDSPMHAGRGWLRETWEGLRNTRPVFQMGLGFALGVLILLPAVWNSSELAFDPGQVAGSISRSRPALAIQGPDLSGELFKERINGELHLELRLESQGPVAVEIVPGSPVGLVAWESVPASPGSLQFATDRWTIQHIGVATYRFRLDRATDSWPKLSIGILRDGRPIFQEVVP